LRLIFFGTLGKRKMGKLDGKVAVVTGAARGLGRGYAKRLAGLGA
jgi:3-oxoacyl-[acyl-carrier protein] reductase